MLHFIGIAVILSSRHIRDFPITQSPKQPQQAHQLGYEDTQMGLKHSKRRGLKSK